VYLAHVGLLHEQEGHARSEKDDARLGILGQCLALKVFLPKGNIVVGEPIVPQGLEVLVGKTNIVIAEDGFLG
jgi:hypothetical protein